MAPSASAKTWPNEGSDPSAQACAPLDRQAEQRDDTAQHEDIDSAEHAPHYRAIRTARYTYAVTREGRWLLLDRQEDPYEMKDLSNDPAHAELMRGFDAQIQAWMASTGDPFVYPKLA